MSNSNLEVNSHILIHFTVFSSYFMVFYGTFSGDLFDVDLKFNGKKNLPGRRVFSLPLLDITF